MFRKAFLYGAAASMFFAFTFIFNRSMNLSGGYWMWAASLRYIAIFIMLFFLLLKGNRTEPVIEAIKKEPVGWFIWSTVGFGFFYSMNCLASTMAESWYVAAVWQITIVMGIMLTPLFGHRIPLKNIAFSCMILFGIFLLQWSHIQSGNFNGNPLAALLCLSIAAVSYPLGNRKMLSICPPGLSTMQRLFGMTLCSMPFWIVISVLAFYRVGWPSTDQIVQASMVAFFSGVTASYLFFEATRMVKDNPKHLAAVEATQAGEVIFTLIGGILFLHDSIPSGLGIVGILIVIAGMIMNSLV